MGDQKGPSKFKPEESPAVSPLLTEAEAAEEVLAWETNADQEMEREHNHEIHSLRLVHAWLLFGLTVVWVIVIWVVILLQGFGGWYFPMPSWLKRIPFELSDAVLIAFMTTTTATVLGLYGIAAYWLYGKPRKAASAGKKRK